MAVWKTKWGWRAEFEHRGERVRAKGTFRYKDDARNWVREEKKRIKDKKRSSPANDLMLYDLSQKYLVSCKIDFSKKTFDEKKFCLERFYEAVGDILVTDVEPVHILDFVNKRAKSMSKNAANKDRKNLKAFYSWLLEMYGVMYDPTAPIKKKPHEKNPRRLIPIQDILEVLMAAKGHDRVFIGTFWHTGARLGEVFRLTWADDINSRNDG